MWRGVIIVVVSLSACAEFPDVDAALAKGDATRDYPALLPFEQLLNAEEPRLADTDDEALRARADALRGRADALRGPVIDGNTRGRMADGVRQP
ncbi:hypothetical protein [Marivita hallyeonensis]|uniref:Uncharacterized protein n=1 Tax=Marivita hallyeonensis TaxID=996342 RepID=A0A1M5N4S0_9RHOB|nr:hypothetical protein [Marivita hallyeonensis]SHG84455.1 hypothetical protein SAMN05443551_0767 [Marivita hallyeonensis]